MSLIDTLKTKKVTLNQIISLVLLAVSGLVAINIFQKQNKGIAQMVRLQDEERNKNDVLRRIDELKKKMAFYREMLQPKGRREIINTITNLAKNTLVDIVSLRPGESQGPGRGAKRQIYYKTFFHLIINVKSYRQLNRFINILENSPMVFVIESLRITKLVVADLVSRPDKLVVEVVISKLSI